MNINLVTQYPPSTARVGNGAENEARLGDKPGTSDKTEIRERPGAANRPGASDKAEASNGAPVAVGTPVAQDLKANAESERPIGNTHDAPTSAAVRVELKIDEGTGRIVGRVVDTSTDKVVRELPPEDLLRYLEKTRELFDDLTNHDLGLAVDKRV